MFCFIDLMTQFVKPNFIKNFGFLSWTWKYGYYLGGFSLTSVIRVNNATCNPRRPSGFHPGFSFWCRKIWSPLFAQRFKQKSKIGHHHFLLLCAIIYVAVFWSKRSTPPIPSMHFWCIVVAQYRLDLSSPDILLCFCSGI